MDIKCLEYLNNSEELKFVQAYCQCGDEFAVETQIRAPIQVTNS
jgi:hypothetical protein